MPKVPPFSKSWWKDGSEGFIFFTSDRPVGIKGRTVAGCGGSTKVAPLPLGAAATFGSADFSFLFLKDVEEFFPVLL